LSDFISSSDPVEQRRSSPPQKRGRGSKILAAVIAVLLVAGGGAYALYLDHERDLAAAQRAEQRQAEKERQEAEAAAKEAAEAERAAEQQAYEECVSELSPLMDALSEVDARLDVGLSQSDFSDLVGDASVAYNRVDADELAGECLSAGAKLETALNKYSRAASEWNDCIWDDWCTMDSIDPQLQRKWSDAADAIEEAEDLLDELDPASSRTT
jgi:tetratricopeptide (TPR) repeat protein